jgi:cytochrome o ubiquinol oxidase subunit 2
MKRVKLLLGVVAILCAGLAIFFVLRSDHALVTHPQGMIAERELHLIKTNILLMLVVAVPTLFLLFFIAWKYRDKNSKTVHEPEHSSRCLSEVIMWSIPSAVIAVMAFITWHAAHELDPYQPIRSDEKPLTIEVVALDWKWLFIYPEHGIASLNFIQFPEKTPIRFRLCADGSPMNSFWIPQLSGQIYAMTGMITPLHIMADGTGEYAGRAAEINGDGFADMTFVAKSTSQKDFEGWVGQAKSSSLQLTRIAYEELLKPSKNNPIALYSDVEENLFHHIVMKNMGPWENCH